MIFMMTPTDTSKLYPAPVLPDRTNWRDKIALNALGAAAIIVIVLLGFGTVGFWNWIRSFL